MTSSATKHVIWTTIRVTKLPSIQVSPGVNASKLCRSGYAGPSKNRWSAWCICTPHFFDPWTRVRHRSPYLLPTTLVNITD